MNEKQTEKLYDSLTNVDDRFLQEVFEQPKPKKHSLWLKWGTLAACLCLVAAGVHVLQHQAAPEIYEPQTGGGTAPVTTPAAETSEPADAVCIRLSDLVVNEIAEMTADASRLWRDPDLYEEAVWDEAEVRAYYGKDLAPAYIPEGLYPASENGKGHVYLQKSDGKVIEDTVWLCYYHDYYDDNSPRQTEDVAACKGFHLRASRLGLLSCCYYLMPEDERQTSDIGGIPVTIGYRSMPYGPYDAETHEPSGFYDLYVAEFRFDGIEYQIVAEQMELEDLVKVVSSVIYGKQEIVVQK